MKNIIKFKKGECSWIRYMKKRLKNNLNLNVLFVGDTGSSKTYSCMRKGYEIDPLFDPRKQLAFDFLGLMKIINNFNDPNHELGKREYKFCVYDEPQNSIGSRKWQSQMNQLFNELLSTFRNQRIIVCFCVPYADFIDAAARKLIHCEFTMQGWSKKTNKAHAKPLLLQYNSRLSKYYRHCLYVIRDGHYNKLTDLYINKPPQHIIDDYELMKTAFTSATNARITKKLEALEAEENAASNPTQELNPESMQPKVWEVAQLGYVSQQDLADKLTKVLGRVVNQSQLNKNIISMRRKGWDIRDFKNK